PLGRLRSSSFREGFVPERISGNHHGTECQPVGANAIPLVNEHSLRLEELSDAEPRPGHDIFEDRCQNGQCIAAEHSSLGDLRDGARLGDSDCESIPRIDVQHHVYIGAAVPAIDHVVGTDLAIALQNIKSSHLAITSRRMCNALYLTARFVTQFSSKDV